MKPEDVIGLDGIANRCGVSKSTVRQWRSRFGDFPQPGRLGGTDGPGSAPWWNWQQVETWLDQHPTLGNRT